MITKWISIYLLASYTFGVAMPIIGHSIICMLRGNFDTSAWYFPPAMDFLLDTSTFFGWYLRSFAYISGGYAYVLTVLIIVPYLASCSFYIKASCKHFQLLLDECDENVSTEFDDKSAQIEMIFAKIKCAVLLHIKITE